MGQKVNPHGMRLGIVKTWDAKWFAGKDYAENLHEDIRIRTELMKSLKEAGVEKVIRKTYNNVSVDTELLDCDYYRFQELDAGAVNAYQCEYMSQYYWADFMYGDY